ncbi:MAG: hypothetical protein JWP94_1493 [Mucilaginibacter sp.]|jgi:O-antigen/teichoic acid export membrane protein|nr:hypothetical protein [Mucilaginibacter sp.]
MKSILTEKFNRLKQYPFFRNVLLVSGGTVVAQALTLLCSPIITRLYSAVDFGVFQQYQSVLSFLVIAGAFRYELAILVPNEEEDAFSLTALSVCLNIFMFFFLSLIVAGIYIADIHFTFIKGFEQYIWFLPLSFLGASLYQTLTNLIIRQKSFSKISSTKIGQSVGLVFGQISGGYLLTKPFGLFVGDVIGKSLGIVTFLKHIIKNFTKELKKINLKSIKKNLIRYKDYPLISAPGALLNIAGFAIPSLLIGSFFGLKVLGFYALVDRLFSSPSVLIGQSVSQVYISDASRIAKNDPEKLKRTFLKLIKYLSLISFFPLLIAAIIAPSAFAVIFGSQWREAGIYVSILAPMQFVSFIVWPLIPTLNLLERQRWQLAWEVSRVVINCVSLLLMHYWGANARFAIAGYGAAMFCGYLLHLLLSYRAINLQVSRFNEMRR